MYRSFLFNRKLTIIESIFSSFRVGYTVYAKSECIIFRTFTLHSCIRESHRRRRNNGAMLLSTGGHCVQVDCVRYDSHGGICNILYVVCAVFSQTGGALWYSVTECSRRIESSVFPRRFIDDFPDNDVIMRFKFYRNAI